MTIQQAIEKAIEGGFKLYRGDSEPKMYDCENGSIEKHIFLDPLFWQSLGKAVGWEGDYGDLICTNPWHKSNPDDSPDCEVEEHGEEWTKHRWQAEMHRLIDHLAEGGTPESFFETL